MNSDEPQSDGTYSKHNHARTCSGCGASVNPDGKFSVVNVSGTLEIPRFQLPHVLCRLCSERLDDWFNADRPTAGDLYAESAYPDENA